MDLSRFMSLRFSKSGDHESTLSEKLLNLYMNVFFKVRHGINIPNLAFPTFWMSSKKDSVGTRNPQNSLIHKESPKVHLTATSMRFLYFCQMTCCCPSSFVWVIPICRICCCLQNRMPSNATRCDDLWIDDIDLLWLACELLNESE